MACTNFQSRRSCAASHQRLDWPPSCRNSGALTGANLWSHPMACMVLAAVLLSAPLGAEARHPRLEGLCMLLLLMIAWRAGSRLPPMEGALLRKRAAEAEALVLNTPAAAKRSTTSA